MVIPKRVSVVYQGRWATAHTCTVCIRADCSLEDISLETSTGPMCLWFAEESGDELKPGAAILSGISHGAAHTKPYGRNHNNMDDA